MITSQKNRKTETERTALREIKISPGLSKHSPGSVLISYGNTIVQCSVTIENSVPRFMSNRRDGGWLTAEYSMLPTATQTRCERSSYRKVNQRNIEIQRLIGRSLRNSINLKMLPELTLVVDCDVIQADGGTRCASITGSCVALVQAIQDLQYRKVINCNPLKFLVCGVSLGLHGNNVILDMNYEEDKITDLDMNVVIANDSSIREVQSSVENNMSSPDLARITEMLNFAVEASRKIFSIQAKYLGLSSENIKI
jgi:ribonuclease PH